MRFVLAVMEAGEDHSIPHELEPLIREFCDVIPNELAATLLPTRDIQHHIYLAPGSSLSNRLHYCMTPKEYKELNRQVLELADKGLIR